MLVCRLRQRTRAQCLRRARRDATRRDCLTSQTLFKPVFQSKYGKVKIYKIKKISKKSKDWVADPANRVCDAPGSWYCEGQYPPAIESLIAMRKNFAQLEDFNVKKDASDAKYQEQYHKRMEERSGGGDGGGRYGDGEEDGAPRSKNLALTFVGCYGSEASLGADKVYGGGESGASLEAAVSFAREQRKRYVAVARAGIDGHSFAFTDKPTGTAVRDVGNDQGCSRPCVDTDADSGLYCGCADQGCGSVKPAAGESNVRRWMVYELPKKKSSKKKKGSGDL